MKIFQWLQNVVQYIWDGVSRLFKPSDDDYPQSGVQPFEGDPYDNDDRDF